MLISLTVKNFTLVEHLEVDFDRGMTAITGETGAGKSLVLDALGTALGDRADSDRIRQGAEQAEVAALFDLEGNEDARHWLQVNDLAVTSDATEPGQEALLRRLFNRQGRSRGYINGQPATMQQLQQLGELLIDIHSQHEHQSLLKKDTHRKLLDAFAGHEALVQEVSQQFRHWSQLAQRLSALEAGADEVAARRELLEFQVRELDALALVPGELKELEREQHLLANGEHILRDSHQLLALCGESEEMDLTSLLNKALGLLAGMPEKTGRLVSAENLLDSALIQVREAFDDIRHHIDGFELDPERLEYIERRLSDAYQLARKHRIPPEELCDLHQQLSAELEQLTGGDGNLDSLREQTENSARELKQLADRLSAGRRQAADNFALAVNSQLQSLAMGGASLRPELVGSNTTTAQGNETVEFLIRTNPGQPYKPLARIASGGELSRISLAIQVVAARTSRIPTLVFDEVDVGIGGAVAEVVGRLLRTLGEDGQVICVTHLPQVASCAHRQMTVSKSSDGEHAESTIKPLSEDQRVEEIARMLGGAVITAQTRAHAEEMLTLTSV